ncbi:unnamed protein product [Linum tenue]|uniref:Uncharacterized protein n=2 Tax=Linum tenue TaxID=586396 RepID=A0AAV0LC43_9ROSI|nr:unnamed protein product [Linum tenue]
MNDPKIVLVTGCGKGGIGFEYCKAFAEHNCHVIATDIPSRVDDMAELKESLDDKIETFGLDVSSDESVHSTITDVIAKHGRIDILINNAGIGSTGPLAELPLDVIRKAWEINSLGQLRMVQSVVPHMASRRQGTIVNIGSVVGKAATPWAGSYCASKAYVHAMSHSLRVELRPFGINVVLVMPGSIKSNLGRANTEKLQGVHDWKIYKDFKEAIAERARASQGPKATDAAVFAREVAKRVLRAKPSKLVTLGHMTGLFALLSASPLWVRDLFFSRRFGLNKKV